MANLIRSAKSGSDWTTIDLMAYNITVTPQSPQDFFRRNPNLLLLGIDQSLVDSTVDANDVTDETFHYLTHLDLAIHAGHQNLFNDFSRETLRILGFSERGLALSMRFNIPLTICGNNRRFAQTDLCLLDRGSMILLILQEDKMMFNPMDRESQVIAGAIAAYQYNNEKRQKRGLRTLDDMLMPCITMAVTRPTFYLVPVTRALSAAVVTGQYPQTPTAVVKCVTPNHLSSEGMEAPAYRRVAFQRFVAFKDLAKEYWETFLV